MSGHSKWATTKHQKALIDSKRGNLFTKLSHNITLAARDGGDTAINFKLRLAIEKARNANMPKDNIERAVKRGTGELKDGAALQEIIYEGFGPAKVAIIVQCLTDNKNRTASEIKHIFSHFGGNLGSPNSVSWMFVKRGVITTENFEPAKKEELELKIIDAGAEDMVEEAGCFIVYTDPTKLPTVKESLENNGIKIADAEIKMLPKEKLTIADENTNATLEKMFEALDESDDVCDYYTNLE